MPARFSSAGLVGGPLAWAVSLQGNYVLAGWQCGRAFPITGIALALAALSLASSYLSFRAARHAGREPLPPHRTRRTEGFIATVAAWTGLLFAVGILLQALAGVILSGCER